MMHSTAYSNKMFVPIENILNVPVNIIMKGTTPAIEMRKISNDPEIVMSIIDAMINEKPILIIPKTTKNKLVLLSNLIRTGLVSRNSEGEIIYNF